MGSAGFISSTAVRLLSRVSCLLILVVYSRRGGSEGALCRMAACANSTWNTSDKTLSPSPQNLNAKA